MFKVTNKHLEALEANVEQFGEVWIHGDGMMYIDRQDREAAHQPSFIHMTFPAHFNIGDNPAKYRLKFTKFDKLPSTVEELQNMFFAGKNQELIDAAKVKDNNVIVYQAPKKEKKVNKQIKTD